MGPHRVICGDSTSVDVWQKVMMGESADICWMDPPYNVAYESKLAGSITNDNMGDESFRQFLVDLHTAVFTVMKPGAAIYVAHSDTEGYNFRHAFLAAGFKLSGCLVWRKDSLVLGRSDYQWQHEPILYGWRPGSRHRWYGGRKLTTIQDWGGDPVNQLPDGRWAIQVGDTVLLVSGEAHLEEVPSSVHFHEKPKRSEQHPTMKPVGLIERHLRSSARSGDIVIDACGGSGSTMLAAERMGMSSRLVELDPKFVDVIVRRWQEWTGRRAVHADTGEPFPEVA
jgi:DNA modification methylase